MGQFLDSLVSHAGHAMMAACSRDGLVATVGEDGMVTVIDPDRDAGAGVTRTRVGAVLANGFQLVSLSEGEPDSSLFGDAASYRSRKSIPAYLIVRALAV